MNIVFTAAIGKTQFEHERALLYARGIGDKSLCRGPGIVTAEEDYHEHRSEDEIPKTSLHEDPPGEHNFE